LAACSFGGGVLRIFCARRSDFKKRCKINSKR
jgi:hypothetical protein